MQQLNISGNQTHTFTAENFNQVSLDNVAPFTIFDPNAVVAAQIPKGSVLLGYNLAITDIHASFTLPSLRPNPFPETTELESTSVQIQQMIAHKQKYSPSTGHAIEMSFYSLSRGELTSEGLTPDIWNKTSYEYFYNLGNLPHYFPLKSPYFTLEETELYRSEPIGILISDGELKGRDRISINIVWEASVAVNFYSAPPPPSNVAHYQSLINFLDNNEPIQIVPNRPEGRASLFLFNKGSNRIIFAPTQYTAQNRLGPALEPKGAFNLKGKQLDGNVTSNFIYLDNFLFIPSGELWGIAEEGTSTLGVLEYYYY